MSEVFTKLVNGVVEPCTQEEIDEILASRTLPKPNQA